MYSIYANIRNEKGLKDFDVAKATGISTATFSDWKHGRYTPKADKIAKIADYLGVSVEYLMTGKDAPKESTDGSTYYFNDETAKKAQELFQNPGMRMLFDAARDSRPEDLQMAADLLARLKETNPDNG